MVRVVAANWIPKTGIFKEKLDKEIPVSKFTFPSLKEGSIIEYEYRQVRLAMQSSFMGIRWDYIPVCGGIYCKLPRLSWVRLRSQGYQKMDVTEGKSRRVPSVLSWKPGNQQQSDMNLP